MFCSKREINCTQNESTIQRWTRATCELRFNKVCGTSWMHFISIHRIFSFFFSSSFSLFALCVQGNNRLKRVANSAWYFRSKSFRFQQAHNDISLSLVNSECRPTWMTEILMKKHTWHFTWYPHFRRSEKHHTTNRSIRKRVLVRYSLGKQKHHNVEINQHILRKARWKKGGTIMEKIISNTQRFLSSLCSSRSIIP